jgi:hypothetical protein
MLNLKSRISDATVAVLAAVVVLSLAACDAPSITGPSAGATAAAETTVILSADLLDVEAGGQRTLNFNLPHAGALALTVHWTDSNNSVTAVLTGADCPAADATAHCQGQRSVERERREGREGREGREDREGAIDQPSASGAYHLLLQNEGPGTESIHVTGVLTSSHPTPTPTTYPTIYPTPYPYPTPDPYQTNYPRQ